jgi:cold shock CspA family protein
VTTLRGVVEGFDDRRGDGTVRTASGERLYFHCVAIADGSRTITPGTAVSLRRGVGHLGRDEALEIAAAVDDEDGE